PIQGIMELIGNGLDKGSHMYFYTASQTAKKLLYYPIAIGEFYCNGDYCVERTTNYDSILAIYVLDGCMTLQQESNTVTAYQNELLLVDCYKPHKYFADTTAHTLWMHFDGNNSRQWFDEIRLKKGQKIKCNRQAADCISSIIKHIKFNQNEYDISNELYSLLCLISKSNELTYESKKTDFIEKSKDFILSNYDKNITVEEIADKALMSISFFSKVFKETTGFSPYDYLLSVRLDKAKELLQKTDDSIQNIAFKTGFNSTSNFIYFFKKQTGISPLKFRKIKF
ncbi:MAG: helix-turn-helix transcriptional regulator, partial [Eubacterium sp.]|nr:helix-turn-helix transcriptional regulator [Eubacterium sp.]